MLRLILRRRILFAMILFVLIAARPAEAYIGPGAGFAIAGSLFVVLMTMLAGIAAFFTWPVRYLIRLIRGRKAYAAAKVKRFVVVGMDGMDPGLVEKFMGEGKLPNLKKLREKGCFKPLASTVPPISPVAWSSFQTGANPGKHNIFDFLTANTQSYQPQLSSVSINEPKRHINIGPYRIPIGRADIRLLRKSKPFWETLGEHGVFSNVLRVPITYPPVKYKGLLLSAMCVPDLLGTQGTFSFYTTAKGDAAERTGGCVYCFERVGDKIRDRFVGPANPLRKDNRELVCPFEITVKDKATVVVKIDGEKYTLKKGEYSDWICVKFKVAPLIKVSGICRLLLVNVEPELELYVTPINIDPERPVMPVSYPSFYSTYLSKRIGRFATLGLAEDSWALNEGILNDETFLRQCLDIEDEREKMFFDAIDKLKRGLCVCVFDGTDRLQHTYWRYIDEEHPAHKEHEELSDDNPIEYIYKRYDELAGKVIERCDDKDTVVMIVSDHGFTGFRYGVDLNRWLERNGYLVIDEKLKSDSNPSGVDYSKSRAFAVGLAGIFLNLKGRNAEGTVKPGAEALAVCEEISQKLEGLVDEQRGGAQAVRKVYIAEKIYSGPYKGNAPDLIVGFNKGYRASWQTAIGQITDELFHDNTKAWSGDHCVDRSLVPGVIFCNRAIATERPWLGDIAPTVLEMFGIKPAKYMDGRALTFMNGTGGDVEENGGKLK